MTSSVRSLPTLGALLVLFGAPASAAELIAATGQSITPSAAAGACSGRPLGAEQRAADQGFAAQVGVMWQQVLNLARIGRPAASQVCVYLCLCVCACARARAHACACVRACV